MGARLAWALFTVTVTAVAVREFPAASRAIAVSTWLAFDALVVFQTTAYGATVSSAPRFAPSSRNCTPTTPTASEAVAATETLAPETVAPLAGELMATVGGVVSPVGEGTV